MKSSLYYTKTHLRPPPICILVLDVEVSACVQTLYYFRKRFKARVRVQILWFDAGLYLFYSTFLIYYLLSKVASF